MKEYNCPDCKVNEDSCIGCQRYWQHNEHKINLGIDVWDYDWSKNALINIPNCCRNCSNHPSNGGSGICNCTLPYFEMHTTSEKSKSGKSNLTYITTSATNYICNALDNIEGDK